MQIREDIAVILDGREVSPATAEKILLHYAAAAGEDIGKIRRALQYAIHPEVRAGKIHRHACNLVHHVSNSRITIKEQ